MKNKINKNKSFIKKIFVKLIRKFGYEIIDQSNLTLPDENLYVGKNLSKGGVKSITIPLGETSITRVVESITIIIRSYTFGDINNNQVMLDQNKKRIFEFPKEEYTFRTINSVVKSCQYAKKIFKNIKFKIIITDDKSKIEIINKINSILKNNEIEYEIIKLRDDEFLDIIEKTDTDGNEISKNMISNMRNNYKSCLGNFN